MMDLWAQLHPNHKTPPSIPTEYPKWIDAPDGRRIVNSRREEAEALGLEFSEETAEEVSETENALFPSAASEPAITGEWTDGEGDYEKTQLQMLAQERGIKIDRRWGVKKLRAEIEKHQ